MTLISIQPTLLPLTTQEFNALLRWAKDRNLSPENALRLLAFHGLEQIIAQPEPSSAVEEFEHDAVDVEGGGH